MKIGLLTIFNAPNYGALLQCYSLCNYLIKLGHEVVLFEVPLFRKDTISYKIKEVFLYSFIKNFTNKYLPKITTELQEKVDVYLIGSDQVWNPDITGAMYDKYFLSFVPLHTKKKISYAASIGVNVWSRPDLSDRVKTLLNDFETITVREMSAVQLLRKEFGIESELVLDPCFLLDSFSELLKTKGKISANTLVSYKLIYSYKWNKIITQTVKVLQCKSVELRKRRIAFCKDLHDFNLHFTSIKNWITSIASAKYIVTDSYHGMVFAIIFEKQFVVVSSIDSRLTRISSLLNLLGLENRLLKDVDASEISKLLNTPIDYQKVNELLEKYKNHSKRLLAAMLK